MIFLDLLVGLLIGAACVACVFIGAKFQRDLPMLVRTRDSKETLEWQQALPKKGWGPTHPNPMGPPPPPPNSKETLSAKVRSSFLEPDQ